MGSGFVNKLFMSLCALAGRFLTVWMPTDILSESNAFTPIFGQRKSIEVGHIREPAPRGYDLPNDRASDRVVNRLCGV